MRAEPKITLKEWAALQYVGKSELVTERIKQHRRNGLIPFDRYRFLPLESISLGFTERAYIDRYSPPFNKQRRSPMR